MKKQINISKNKTLILDNVVGAYILNEKRISEELCDSSLVSSELIAEQIDNEIKHKGAVPIGPIIQYSRADVAENGDLGMEIKLMRQASKPIYKIGHSFDFISELKIKNCVYARFIGYEDDVQYAYQKIQVLAYEEDIKLRGDSYTIAVDYDDDTDFSTIDIFMVKDI